METIEEGKTITREEFEEISAGMDDGEIERCIWWVLDDGIDNTNAAKIAVDALSAYTALKAESESRRLSLIQKSDELRKAEAERDALKEMCARSYIGDTSVRKDIYDELGTEFINAIALKEANRY